MNIIYYVTDHGLGHASRTVAIVRELLKENVKVVIRNNDPIRFFKKSLPKLRIIHETTDLIPVMEKNNPLSIDSKKTQKRISKWIDDLPRIINRESRFLEKEKPDLVLTDISIMPILASVKNNIKSIAISSFVWNETLDMKGKNSNFFKKSYEKANLIIKLPLGTPMKFLNVHKMGLVARKINQKRSFVRQELGIPKDKKLVLLSLGGLKEKPKIKKMSSIEFLDISDYSKIGKTNSKINLVEGQNLINASDLVICKCGYGFISECLTTGTKFRYVLEPKHKEANAIHKDLLKLGLKNMITLRDLENSIIDTNFIENSQFLKTEAHNQTIAQKILNVV